MKVFQQFFMKLVNKVLHEGHNRESFFSEFQQYIATTKVFHHERFALYGTLRHFKPENSFLSCVKRFDILQDILHIIVIIKSK